DTYYLSLHDALPICHRWHRATRPCTRCNRVSNERARLIGATLCSTTWTGIEGTARYTKTRRTYLRVTDGEKRRVGIDRASKPFFCYSLSTWIVVTTWSRYSSMSAVPTEAFRCSPQILNSPIDTSTGSRSVRIVA